MRYIACLVGLILVGAWACHAQRVAVWVDEDLGPRAAEVSDWLRRCGCQVIFVDTAALSQAGELSPERYEMLVVPYGARYPATRKSPYCSLPSLRKP